MTKQYVVVFEVTVCVDAENEDEAIDMAEQDVVMGDFELMLVQEQA